MLFQFCSRLTIYLNLRICSVLISIVNCGNDFTVIEFKVDISYAIYADACF